MIKLEHVVLPSPDEMLFVIEGMRNPMNSWDNSDSLAYYHGDYYNVVGDSGPAADEPDGFYLGDKDLGLMNSLAKAGTDHRKFMRMMPVYARITAPLYWQTLSANETLFLLIGGGHALYLAWLTGNHPLESRGKHFKNIRE